VPGSFGTRRYLGLFKALHGAMPPAGFYARIVVTHSR